MKDTRTVSGLPMATNGPGALYLSFNADVPDYPETDFEKRYRNYYREQAARLLDALQEHVPGGLVDALFAELALRKASILCVYDSTTVRREL